MKLLTTNIESLLSIAADSFKLVRLIGKGKLADGVVFCEKIMKKLQEIQDNFAVVHAELLESKKEAEVDSAISLQDSHRSA